MLSDKIRLRRPSPPSQLPFPSQVCVLPTVVGFVQGAHEEGKVDAQLAADAYSDL